MEELDPENLGYIELWQLKALLLKRDNYMNYSRQQSNVSATAAGEWSQNNSGPLAKPHLLLRIRTLRHKLALAVTFLLLQLAAGRNSPALAGSFYEGSPPPPPPPPPPGWSTFKMVATGVTCLGFLLTLTSFSRKIYGYIVADAGVTCLGFLLTVTSFSRKIYGCIVAAAGVTCLGFLLTVTSFSRKIYGCMVAAADASSNDRADDRADSDANSNDRADSDANSDEAPDANSDARADSDDRADSDEAPSVSGEGSVSGVS